MGSSTSKVLKDEAGRDFVPVNDRLLWSANITILFSIKIPRDSYVRQYLKLTSKKFDSNQRNHKALNI